jgi:peptidoglycan/xylan/chitin deacetylase (PgdA/CDA1 family)
VVFISSLGTDERFFFSALRKATIQMNPMRPAGMIVALALVLGVFIITLGIFAGRSSDDNASPTESPDVATNSDSTQSDITTTPDGTPEDPVEPPSEQDNGDDASASPVEEAEPTEEPEPAQEPLTDEELQQYQPNELGQIMVLMYHRIEAQDNPDDVWTRTPDQFRGDLQWLYDNDFYIIPISDYVRNEINAPAGKRPVVLTFDDGTVGQFRMIEQNDGSVVIDPDSAVGILEEFASRYDDFTGGGLFSILPLAPFAWPDAEDQRPFAEEKLQWLVDNGYELGNHTVGHINMGETPDEEIKSELARAERLIQDYVPDADISVLAVPFGVYPNQGETTIFEGWEYDGEQFALEAALMVGAEPAPSPVHVDFDPMWIPRINGDDEQLGRWFSFMEDNPGIIYVSDGNPNTITIPEDLHPWLVDTLDETKVEGKEVIRY